MPIYEFRCDACGARFARLVDAGTRSAVCPECEAEDSRRVLSAQAAPMQLVKPAAERRKQERRNAALRESTRDSFRKGLRRAGRTPAKGGDR
ncbi:MAG: FmdB family zinc ribbon protein [Solirubrobacterales bacterium]